MDIDTLLEKLNGRLDRVGATLPSVKQEMTRQEEALAQILAALTAEAQAASKQLHAERVRLVAALDRQLARIAELGAHAVATLDASAEAAHAHAGATRRGGETVLAEAGTLRQHIDALTRSEQALVDAAARRCTQEDHDVAAMVDTLAAAQAGHIDAEAQTLRAETAAASRRLHERMDAFGAHVRHELDGLDTALRSGLHAFAGNASRQLMHDLPERMAGHQGVLANRFHVADEWMNGFGTEFGAIDRDLRERFEQIARLIKTIQPVLDQVKHFV